ncbi:aldo/keto reductase [Rhodovibrio salinarum]|uniref:Aldo/keto reductase n=1 Tax=Rhodovibrio salinarum TaxID=1087 RepID=A0A934QHS7_9PROT|nr:aldo/keto reductase [Rhodovibrio salinarum]MBK1696765.1 aldo/keto reductase [Rhodovibrio salinarum]
METRTLGRNGPALSALGLGCMGMSDFYGPADRDESLATIQAALARGVTLLDTGDFYGHGHNELLLREALQDRRREDVFIAVKFGAMRAPDGQFISYDARPVAVKNFLSYTLQRLGTDYIDLMQPARLDPDVPIEETVGAIGEMVQAGYVRHIGLSEMAADTIRRAASEQPIQALQIEYSLMSRGIEREILPTCRELGISVTAYGVLSRGLLSDSPVRARVGNAGDFRAHSPRFQGANLERNLQLVEAVRRVAEAKQATVAQIAIAWVLAQGDDIIPLVGARRRSRLDEALGALDIALDDRDLAAIAAALPADAVAGNRYNEHQMAMLDSERSTSG